MGRNCWCGHRQPLHLDLASGSAHLESVRRTTARNEQARYRMLGDNKVRIGSLGIPAKALIAERAVGESGHTLGEKATD